MKIALKELKGKYERLYRSVHGFEPRKVPSFKYYRTYYGSKPVAMPRKKSNALKRAWYSRIIYDLEPRLFYMKKRKAKQKTMKKVAKKRQTDILKWKRFYEKHHGALK